DRVDVIPRKLWAMTWGWTVWTPPLHGTEGGTGVRSLLPPVPDPPSRYSDPLPVANPPHRPARDATLAPPPRFRPDRPLPQPDPVQPRVGGSRGDRGPVARPPVPPA